jgi:regulator of protease activity HflC (stomatin/prohibitin superfamily)
MNTRTIRRAQERRAAKQARKAAILSEKAQGMSQIQLVADRPDAPVPAERISETNEAKSPLSVSKTRRSARKNSASFSRWSTRNGA